MSDDIVNKLQTLCHPASEFLPNGKRLDLLIQRGKEAADEIVRLRGEVERLRESLKPFAAHNNWSEDWHDGSSCEISVQLRDIRLAASLVGGYDWTPDVD